MNTSNKFIYHPQNRPKKLAVLCQLFFPEMISTGQTMTELCEVLNELGIKITVVAGPPTILEHKTKTSRKIDYKGIMVKRVWGTRFSKLSFMGKLINQLTYAVCTFFYMMLQHKPKIPILVLTNPPFLAVICALIHKVKRTPFIYLIFDVYPDTAVKLNLLKENSILARTWDWWNGFILKYASHVVVIGRCMQKVILAKGKNIPSLPQKIHRIHIWSDDREIKPVSRDKNPYIAKWNLENKFVVEYSGNMGRFHDMETIIQAAEKLQGHPDILFLFVGEGHKKRWLIDYAGKKSMKNCRFFGYVDRADLKYALNCAHIGVVSLLEGQEGLSVPSKAYGIMAAGVPLLGIMNSNSEIAKTIHENTCGIVVNPGDVKSLVHAILTMYSDNGLRDSYGQNGLLAIQQKYNLKNAASLYCSMIESLQ